MSNAKLPWRFVRGHQFMLVAVAGLVMLVASLSIVVPLYSQLTIERIIPQADQTLLHYSFYGFLAFLGLRLGLTYLQDRMVAYFRQAIERDFCLNYIQAIFNIQLEQLNRYQVGELSNRFSVFLNDIEWFLCDMIFFIGYALFMFVALALGMLWLNPLMFFVVMMFLPLHGYNFRQSAKQLHQTSAAYLAQQAQVAGTTLNLLQARPTIRNLGLAPLIQQRFSQAVTAMYQAFTHNQQAQYRQSQIQTALVGLNTVAVVLLGSYQVQQQQMSLGAVFFFMLLLNFFYAPIYRWSGVSQALQAACVKISEMERLILAPNDLNQPQASFEPAQIQTLRVATYQFGSLIEHANFSLERGKLYMLVGASGSGKTSFFNSLVRFNQPDQAEIWLDQRELASIATPDLRRFIGYALQTPILFQASLAENVTLADAEALDQQQLAFAAYQAIAEPLLAQLPEAWQTNIAEHGQNLSGGQMQRVGLMRLFYANPPIMLLDEPSSALDIYTERLFFERLRQLAREKIIIVISHRPATWHYADQLLRIANQRIQIEAI